MQTITLPKSDTDTGHSETRQIHLFDDESDIAICGYVLRPDSPAPSDEWCGRCLAIDNGQRNN